MFFYILRKHDTNPIDQYGLETLKKSLNMSNRLSVYVCVRVFFFFLSFTFLSDNNVRVRGWLEININQQNNTLLRLAYKQFYWCVDFADWGSMWSSFTRKHYALIMLSKHYALNKNWVNSVLHINFSSTMFFSSTLYVSAGWSLGMYKDTNRACPYLFLVI